MIEQLSRDGAMPNGTGRLVNRERAEMQIIRDALGAIAVGEPAIYWLYRGEDDNWHVHREGEREGACYPDRAEALQALRLAVIRCAGYSLFLQDEDGRFVREFFNWLPDE